MSYKKEGTTKMSDARSRANAKFNKLHTTMFGIRLHNRNDKDIIDHLRAQENKQGYIKKLIRADMQKEQED